MDLYSCIAMLGLGTLLSSATGLRAFLVPFALGCGQGLGWIHLSSELRWLGSPLAIGMLAVAIILEILSDKVPAVHHALDVVHVAVKPVAGAFATASLVHEEAPMLAWTAAILGGGSVAGAIHLTKASLRVGSTVASVGTAAPAHSLAEDVIAIGLAGLALWGMSF